MAGKDEGVQFPLTDGVRSTTGINKEAFAASVAEVSPEMASRIRAEKRWRGRYAKYVVENVELSVKTPENALKVARDGLEYLHNTMEFVRDGVSSSLKEAMDREVNGHPFKTVTIQGQRSRPAKVAYEVPYKGKVLRGDALRIQIEKWVRLGVIEPSCGNNMTKTVDNDNWLDLSDEYFVLLGASSAMGPFLTLMALGANVIAIDIDRAPVWDKLTAVAKDSCGQLILPEKDGVKGCNLLTQTPEIRNWLREVAPGKPVTVGCYAYLDGPLFVKISMAMDAIAQDLTTHRPHTRLAYLCTPTDAHVGTPGASDAASNNLRRAPAWQHMMTMIGQRGLKRASRRPVVSDVDPLDQFYVVDAIVVEQGPNYILAKRLQHWRAMVARSQGCVVSSNIAPSTATVSVVHNKSFALAYQGMPYFNPVEVFQQETSNAVMSALLIHDVRNGNGVSHPDTPLKNPLNLFTDGAFHGGAWRCGYKFGSIGATAAIAYVFVGILMRKVYLTAYNAFQGGAWLYALIGCLLHFTSGSTAPLWDNVGGTISMAQHLMVLEVVHSALGIVPAPVLTTVLQIASRIAVVTCLNTVAAGRNTPFVWMLAVAWALTEVVRYSFYALNTFKVNVAPLTFLRYTMFIVLYPMGVLGEMGTIFHSQPDLKAPETLLEQLSSIFVRQSFWGVITPVYAVGLFTLYSYMLKQRAKVLKGNGKK